MLDGTKSRYIIIGFLNALFGFFSAIGLYKLLSTSINIIFIAILANILGISFSFVTYKIFVFKSKGQWLQEYCKIYLVYGFAFLISTILIWTFVDILKMDIWVSQLIVMVFTFLISYLGHNNFTFAEKKFNG